MQGWRHILLAELDQQCEFALRAYHDATVALGARRPESFWYSLQALFDAASRVSALLWPANDSRRAAFEELRESLLVAENGCLSPSRLPAKLQSAARLPGWADSVRGREVKLSNFGPRGPVEASPERFVRYFDPDGSTFAFCGEVIDCAALMGEIAGLRQTVEAEIHRVETVM